MVRWSNDSQFGIILPISKLINYKALVWCILSTATRGYDNEIGSNRKLERFGEEHPALYTPPVADLWYVRLRASG